MSLVRGVAMSLLCCGVLVCLFVFVVGCFFLFFSEYEKKKRDANIVEMQPTNLSHQTIKRCVHTLRGRKR